MRTAALSPILRLREGLLVSIHAELTDQAVTDLKEDVCHELAESSAIGLILDVSAVELMDSYITQCIRDLAVSARLMGVETVVVGLRPAVVITLVEMGMTLPGVKTALNLDRALDLFEHLRLERKREQEEFDNEDYLESFNIRDEPTR